MFKHIKHDIVRPFAKEEHTEDGHYYRTNDGKLYPSITTIFKLLDSKEWYPFWVAKVAKDMNISTKDAEIECKKIGNNSMKVGTALHKLAEKYLNNEEHFILDGGTKYETNPFDLFEPLKKHLDEHVNNIHATEAKLYSDEMELAGTVDLVAKYDGVPSVIDFKNSRKPKTPSQVKQHNYFEQICAYGKMWEFCTGQKIEQGIVIVISWDKKVRAFKINLKEHEEALWDKLLEYEDHKALNTTE